MIAPNHEAPSPASHSPSPDAAPVLQRELWVEDSELGFERHVFAGPLRLLSDGQLEAHEELKTPAVVLHPALPPVGEAGATAAVLFVPDLVMRHGSLDVRVRGLRVGPGLHVLQHADSIEFGAARVWLSAEGRGERGVYDPARDGADAFCARTKMRLTEGDAIVRCPGSATRPCRLVFKLSAWDPTLVCHGCGHDPATPPWTPPGVAPARTRPGPVAAASTRVPELAADEAVAREIHETHETHEDRAVRPAAVPLSSVAHLSVGSRASAGSATGSAPASIRAEGAQASPARFERPRRSSVRTVDALLDLTSRARAARTPAALPEPESPA